MLLEIGNFLDWNGKIWEVIETSPYLILESPDNPDYCLANPDLEKLGFTLIPLDGWIDTELRRIGVVPATIMAIDQDGAAFTVGNLYIELDKGEDHELYYSLYRDAYSDEEPLVTIDSEDIECIGDFELLGVALCRN